MKTKLFMALPMIGMAMVVFLVVNETSLLQQKEVISPNQLSNRVTELESKDKIKQEIRELLDRQIEALEAENIDAFMGTIDRSDESLYRKIRQELEFLFSNADILKATSEIQTIEPEVNSVVGVTVLNTLIIRYPDGLIETLEKSMFVIKK